MSSDPGRAPSARPQAWTDDKIIRALGDWGWAPDGTQIVDTDDYRLLLRPAEFGHDVHVPRVESSRPPEEIIDEVNRLVAAWGYHDVVWSIYPTTRPSSLADALLRLGGTVTDEGALMSLQVPADGRIDVGPTVGIRVRAVDDVDGLTDYRRVISTVYEQPLPSRQQIATEAEGITDDHDGCRFVAYLDDQPAGTGAIAVRADGSASLFGAATYRSLRGRGAYRAILAARTRWASEHSVPILLVSGRLTTSAPIMRRVGFTDRGQTRNLRLSANATG